MICPKCGRTVKKREMICRQCKTPLEKQNRKKSNRPWKTWIVWAAVMVLFLEIDVMMFVYHGKKECYFLLKEIEREFLQDETMEQGKVQIEMPAVRYGD